MFEGGGWNFRNHVARILRFHEKLFLPDACNVTIITWDIHFWQIVTSPSYFCIFEILLVKFLFWLPAINVQLYIVVSPICERKFRDEVVCQNNLNLLPKLSTSMAFHIFAKCLIICAAGIMRATQLYSCIFLRYTTLCSWGSVRYTSPSSILDVKGGFQTPIFGPRGGLVPLFLDQREGEGGGGI